MKSQCIKSDDNAESIPLYHSIELKANVCEDFMPTSPARAP
jgi:hypothetical protein